MNIKVGVLALQGGVSEHLYHLNKLENVEAAAVKKPDELKSCQGLIIPGGESTAIRKLIKRYNFKEAVLNFHSDKKAIWGTCAGLILMAKSVEGENKEQLGLLDLKVKRNAFGSQLSSFIEKAKIDKVSPELLELVYIRAPIIKEVGNGLDILHQYQGKITAVENKTLLATSFHPELTNNSSFHKYFVDKITQL